MGRFIPKHVALDLDNTLSYFEGGTDGMFQILTDIGVPKEFSKSEYEISKQGGGFNIARFASKINRYISNQKEVEDAILSWLKKNLKPYPDTHPFLEKLRLISVPFSVITLGDPDFQNRKIDMLGIKPDGVYFTSRIGEKPAVLRKMVDVGIGPIIYIDDKSTELDAIRDHLPPESILTIKINRKDSPYIDIASRYKHLEISSLNAPALTRFL